MTPSRGVVVSYWLFTAMFALHMAFTAYAQWKLPQVAAAFVHLGYPAYFRVELACAKLAGVLVLLVPAVPGRMKEWAYAGFAITLVSALISHLAVGDGPQAWGWAVGAGVLWGLSISSGGSLMSTELPVQRSRPGHRGERFRITADRPVPCYCSRHAAPLSLRMPPARAEGSCRPEPGGKLVYSA